MFGAFPVPFLWSLVSALLDFARALLKWLPVVRGTRDGLLSNSLKRTGGCAEGLMNALINHGPDGLR